MKKKSSRSLIIVLLILVLPVVVYGVFELNSLTSDEKEFKRIYERQLETVLFSINQILQDQFAEFANQIENNNGNNEETLSYLSTNPCFGAYYERKIGTNESQVLTHDKTYIDLNYVNNKADSIYEANQDVISRLIRYKEAGDFTKIESSSIPLDWNNQQADFVFFIIGEKENYKFAIIYFNAQLLVEQLLVPKLQEIAREDFVLTVTLDSEDWVLYSTSGDEQVNIKSEALEIIPRFSIGISRNGGTVDDIVNQRKAQNLLALVLLMVVMLIGVFLVFRNIKREMELAQKKSDFVSNVSHEIRTPLALINMFAETLQMGRVKEESKKQEYYGIISKEVGRLTNMINRILSFSKIEANKRVYHKQAFDLNKLVEEVHTTYSYHLENNGFSHSLNLYEEKVMVEADREALIEVLVNLIDNGMKYSFDQKNIEISTGVELGMAVVSVKDAGMGIAKNQQEKLFEKFYRVPTGDVHDTKGSGLGLTIVKHIMDAHNGRIQLVSELGVGSMFKLYFPLET